MKTYIRQNIRGYYIEFDDVIDSQYWEGKTGTTYAQPQGRITIVND